MTSKYDSNLYSIQMSPAYNHLIKIGLFAIAILCDTNNARASILDRQVIGHDNRRQS